MPAEHVLETKALLRLPFSTCGLFLLQDSAEDVRWGSLLADIASRLLEPRFSLKKSTLRLVNKHWRYSVDQSVSDLTIDKLRLRRAGLNATTALSIAERQFTAVTVLRCNCMGDEDWMRQICAGPFRHMKSLTLRGDLGQQCLAHLKQCQALQRLHICSSNLDAQQFQHLSGIVALQTLDMKGSAINNHSISAFSHLSDLKVFR